MEPRIPRGLCKQTGNALTILEVNRGIRCNCVCFECGKDLIGVKGLKIAWHFRHHGYDENNCSGGIESGLHQSAKEIFNRFNWVAMPGGGVFEYELAALEKGYQSIRPDVKLSCKNGEFIFVEIKVTHGVDDKKIQWLRDNNITCIEIDLSKVDRFIDKNDLEKLIIKEIQLKSYIHLKIMKDLSIVTLSSENSIRTWVIALVGAWALIKALQLTPQNRANFKKRNKIKNRRMRNPFY